MADMKFRLSAEYGELSPVRNWQPHSGIDLAMPEGTPLRAVADGVVDRVFDGSGAIGEGLSIKLADGSRAIYGHMNDVKAHVGEHVSAGSLIGLSGNTGNSTGPHLHFGLKDPSGNFTDPTPIAEKLAALSGDKPDFLSGPISKLIDVGTESLREKTADMAIDITLGILDALNDLLFAGTLIGSAILILLKVAGWKDGGRWAGVLIVANVLMRYLTGGA